MSQISTLVLILCAMSPAIIRAGSISVEVTGVTNTQAVLRYNAPDANACSVEVSESASLRPLVHDVNPLYFKDAHLDNRTGALSSTKCVAGSCLSSRIFVVGRRSTERAIDGNLYSRALQAFATHYFRVTCRGSVATGRFTTANIPLGMTYTDAPQGDPLSPGQQLVPTVMDQPIIDPYTGAFIKKVSNIKPVPFLDFGGGTRMCGMQQIGPEAGFLCAFPGDRGGAGQLYYFIPPTGEVRYLGWMSSPGGVIAYPRLIEDDSRVTYVLLKQQLYKGTYVGDYRPQAQGAFAPFQWEVVVPDIVAAIKAFDPTFNMALAGGCYFAATHQSYGLITCRRGGQDSYGSFAIFNFSSRRVVAVKNLIEDSQARWCSIHWSSPVRGYPVATAVPQRLAGPATLPGTGPFRVRLEETITAQQTRIRVSGEPWSEMDGFVSAARTGDYFQLSEKGNSEILRIKNKVSSREWVVERGQKTARSFAFSAGTMLQAECWLLHNGIQYYWDGATGQVHLDRTLGFSHTDWADSLRLNASGYRGVQGAILANLTSPVSFGVSTTVTFAGVAGLSDGNATAKHPSFHQQKAPPSEQNWFLDMVPFNGGNLFSAVPGVVSIGERLYKYQFASVYKQRLNRKQLPTLASTGGYVLRDVSGPSSLLTGSLENSYSYCVAQVAGECRPDSRAGDAYVNVPSIQYNYCAGGDGPNPFRMDVCLTDMPAWAQGVVQFGFQPNSVGLPIGAYNQSYPVYGAGHTRMLTRGLGGVKAISGIAKVIPDASWALFNTVDQSIGGLKNLMMVKVPPTPIPDGINRSTFLGVRIQVPPPRAADASRAVAYFGYHENAIPGEYRCTSRAEACVAVSSSAPADSDPFKFAKVEQQPGIPCKSGCTLTIPAIPMRVAYFEVRYFNEAGNMVEVGPRGVAAEHAVTAMSAN